MTNTKTFEAVNWSKNSGDLAESFWQNQWKQLWFPEEVAVSKDLKQWNNFEHKDTYKKVLAGLTLLDTIQTNIGMNELAKYTPNLKTKALFTSFGAFEAIHAKSYSYIFTTLCKTQEIDEIFEWVKENEYLQIKANKISAIYEGMSEGDEEARYKALVASVYLESFLFYSGFFYPLYLGGQGQLRNASEVISLILRDESLHGVAVGFEAQQIMQTLDKEKQMELKLWAYELLLDLYDNEMKYTDDIYADTGLSGKVKAYVRYNANKALMNLSLDTMFPEEEVDPIVLNGIRNKGTQFDFFSQIGNSYSIATVKPITDDTFKFKGRNI